MAGQEYRWAARALLSHEGANFDLLWQVRECIRTKKARTCCPVMALGEELARVGSLSDKLSSLAAWAARCCWT